MLPRPVLAVVLACLVLAGPVLAQVPGAPLPPAPAEPAAEPPAVTEPAAPGAIPPRSEPGDPAVLVADSRRLRALLGWAPRHDDLDLIVATAWRWEQRLQAMGVQATGG